jgi:hypothetical protein
MSSTAILPGELPHRLHERRVPRREPCRVRVACQPKLVGAESARLRALAGNLRVDSERRLVDQNRASWNQVKAWLGRLVAVQRTA